MKFKLINLIFLINIFSQQVLASDYSANLLRCEDNFRTVEILSDSQNRFVSELSQYILNLFPKEQFEYFKCIFSDVQIDLVFDPAKKKTTVGSLKEALAGKVASNLHIFEAPLLRGPETIEFFDGMGHPWDVKAPLSPDFNPLIDDVFTFNGEQVLKSVRHKLTKSEVNSVTGKIERVRILFDMSWLNEADKLEMHKILRELTIDEQSNVSIVDYSATFSSCVQ